MTRNSLVRLFAVLAIAASACSGDDGATGAQGPAGPAGADGATGPQGPAAPAVSQAKAESCEVCHNGAGAQHQAAYARYTDASNLGLTIVGITSVENTAAPGTYTATMTVDITKDGAPYAGTIAAFPQKTFYATTYEAAAPGQTAKYNTTVNFNANTAAAVAGVPGRFTVTATKQANGATGANVNSDLSFQLELGPAVAFAYVADSPMTFEAFTVYDNVAHDGMEFGTVEYVSAANDAGCQKCHGNPYRKHGYRVAATADLDDFVACKVCHYDSRNGGHQAWQLLVDDAAAYAASHGATTPEQNAKYAYKASVMNDTHMSHAMEFAYPQSMANCVACHEGKLGMILTDANFKPETCKSCHPVTGTGGTDAKRAPALKDVMGAIHGNLDVYAAGANACNTCHASTGFAPTFAEIHSGYNKVIYTADGQKFSEAIKVAITEASVANNVLTVKFSATESPDIAGLDVASITPTVMVGLYGWDTKDFAVAAHGSANGVRNLEWVVGATHPRFTTVSAAGGSWEITANLADWADKLADGTIKRAEITVMPALKDAAGATLALDAPSRTFNLATNAFEDDFFGNSIVDVAKCNNCHDALATTFHSGNRGGSVVACRVCHTTLNGGSHLEMQSRSIDSYVHAIHSMQPFDIGDVDFANPVEVLHLEHHQDSTYPNFTLLNCESCHNPGKYEVPDQAKSMPGLLSQADTVAGRTIGAVPAYVTGPASRACGACHRAASINTDDAGSLAAFNEHTASFGTLVEDGDGVLDGVIEKLMSMF